MPVVLSLLAHPDDAEFLCAGTLMRLKRERDFDVHIATMTAGDCGSIVHPADEIARIRRAENVDAASQIGGHSWCLDEKDLLVFANERTLEKATRLLRLVRPDIILTHSPADYMLDHEQTSAIARAAAFAAPIPNFLPARHIGEPLPKIPHVYYCDALEGKDALGRDISPGCRIDISSVIDDKAAMLARHASQREWLMKHHGMDHYVQAMRDWSAKRGREMGVAYAEGFRQHLGHSYPQDDLLLKLLQ
jgi:LmbE family N-acetylglucosaminyl deacetylase